jgi:SAM-dependent methyltransferase
VQQDEYLKLAEVEDRMWYFRSLHGHVRREIEKWRAEESGDGRQETGDRRRESGSGSACDVLDAGCGTGGLILRMREAWPGWRFSGIDFMPLACELARKRCGPDVDIREASITALPFADGSFDAVVSADVVCQVENPEVAVAEFFRVLRPGGVVAINVPAYMWMWSYHDDTCQTKHRYTRGEMTGLLKGAGFGEARVTHWNALPFPLVWAKRKLFRTAQDTSDVKDYPAAIEAMFDAMMAVEHVWLRMGGRWSWGTSVLAVGRKT